MKLLELRPTQFALGMIEVEAKIKHLETLKPKRLEEYLKAHPVPVVIGPGKVRYIIDHHHLVRACWELGIGHLKQKVESDLSHLEPGPFWSKMKKSNWVYLYDQFGNGPHNPLELPENIKGLADDFYRSLAWGVREEEGYNKVPAPFSEFRWAEFLRKKLKKRHTKDNFWVLVATGLRLCRSRAASKLPGYRGK